MGRNIPGSENMPREVRLKAKLADQNAIANEYEKEISAILKPAQSQRCREVSLQIIGTSAVVNPHFQEILKMTDDQRTKAVELITANRLKKRELAKQVDKKGQAKFDDNET